MHLGLQELQTFSVFFEKLAVGPLGGYSNPQNVPKRALSFLCALDFFGALKKKVFGVVVK